MTQSPPSSSRTTWDAQSLAENPHEAPDKADRVRDMFSAIAGRYDLNNRLHSFGLDQAWRRKAVSLCNVTPWEDVLDVACGTGDLAEAFADAGAANVIGVDFSEQMLARATEKATSRKRPRDTRPPTYLQQDAMNLEFEDASFDIVSIAFGIRNVSDPGRALSEFHRVLRTGGRLVVLEFSEPGNPLLRSMNRLYTHHVMPWTATWIAGDRSGAYRYLPRSVETFLDREAMSKALHDAGFTKVSMHPMVFGVCMAYLGHVRK